MGFSMEKFNINKVGFELFCEARGWTSDQFKTNDKEPSQCIARCLDKNHQQRTFLISKNGNYYGYVGPGKGTIGRNKAWEPVEYVLKKEGGTDVCNQA